MKISFTAWLGVYTTAQYTMASTLAKELAFRLPTVVLLYFNMNPQMYIGATEHNAARKAAGWAGMLFASFSSLDAALRPKYNKVRLFDELAITSVFVALWALFYSMFTEMSIIFMVLGSAAVWMFLADVVTKRCQGISVAPKPHEDLEAMLDALKTNSSGNPEFARNINFLAVVLLTINPEDANTIAVVKMVKYMNAPPPPTNP